MAFGSEGYFFQGQGSVEALDKGCLMSTGNIMDSKSSQSFDFFFPSVGHYTCCNTVDCGAFSILGCSELLLCRGVY